MVYTRRPSDQRCEEIYAYITEYVAENGHSPTFREVGNAVGLRSSSTVSRYIHRLVDEGRITIDECLGSGSDLLAILEGKTDIVFAVNRGEVHQAVPSLQREFRQLVRQLFKGLEEGFVLQGGGKNEVTANCC